MFYLYQTSFIQLMINYTITPLFIFYPFQEKLTPLPKKKNSPTPAISLKSLRKNIYPIPFSPFLLTNTNFESETQTPWFSP